MKLYLDDDSVDALLVRLLHAARHDVQTPTQVNLSGDHDVSHVLHVVRTGRALLTPPHVHIRRDRATAKFGLHPVRMVRSRHFAGHELRALQKIVEENKNMGGLE